LPGEARRAILRNMSIEAETYRFSVDEYHKLGEAGILGEDDRIELLHGELVIMSPIGPRHNHAVRKLNKFFSAREQGHYETSPQCTLLLDDESELVPDIALLRIASHGYFNRHPQATDVLLVVEVANESIAYDRGSKRRAYALAGVPELWIVHLRESSLEVYRKPEGDRYVEELRFGKSDRVAPLLAPDAELALVDFFP
jgi:Uma2 family endonuclease